MNLNPFKLIISLKPQKIEHYFILSAILFGISSLFPNATFGSFIFLGVSVLMFFAVLLSKFRSNPLIGVQRFWYSILVLWTLFLTIMVLFTGTQGLGNNFSTYFASNNMLPNLIPLTLMCYYIDYEYDLRYLFRALLLLCIAYIITSVVSLPEVMAKGALIQAIGVEGNGEDYTSMIVAAGTMISFFPGFLCLFCKKYLNKKETTLFLLACSLQLFIMLYMGRRGQTVQQLLNFLLIWYIYKGRKSSVSIFYGLAIVAAIYLFWSNYEGSLFSIMKERQGIDTRGNMAEDFASTMSLKEWIIGRGWFGQYYESWLGDMRSGIETGYLHLILKGGLIYLIPYIIILTICAYKGLFRSNNFLCRSFGAIALVRIISLIPFGVPFFTVQEMVVWTGVMICNSPNYLNMTDEEVYNEIQ